MKGVLFLNVFCPVCERLIGNSGQDHTFRCECGYVGDGGLSREAIEVIERLMEEAESDRK